jgi:transposase-like protein
MIITTIQHQCRTCGSTNIVKNGRNQCGRQQDRCKDCRAIGVLPPKQSDRPERQEEILRAYQERPRMRGISRIFGVSRNTLADWIKKKSPRCPRSGRRFQTRRRMTCWKSMRRGVSSENGSIRGGCGRCCCDGLVTSSRLSLATTVNGPADGGGNGFRRPFVGAPVIATCGRRMRRCFRQPPIAAWAKRLAKPLIRNAGTRRFVNGWHVMCEQPCRFPSELVGMIVSPNGSLFCII